MRHIESSIQRDVEVWKSVDGFGGYYLVSNHGNVKSLNRIVKGKLDSLIPKIGKVLKQQLSIHGYKRVCLRNGSEKKICFVHRLVALAFIENINNKPFINHINGIKTDNRIENLEWCTHSENVKHSYKLGLQLPVDNGFKKAIKFFKPNSKPVIYPSIREMCRCEQLDQGWVHKYLNGKVGKYKQYDFELI